MSLEDDLRVAHAEPSGLGKKDLARRRRVVRLLRTPPHELDAKGRRRAARIRASFDDAGDYVNLMGGRREHSWVAGTIERDAGGRVRLIEAGGLGRELDVADCALAVVGDKPAGLWFGRARTDRAGYPDGPVDLLEPIG